MLNKDNVRMLAYTERVSWVAPIEGADNIELIGINGWTCIAKKGEFTKNAMCVYFEIDSKLPAAFWSAFMESKGYKVKTMKLNKFKVVSQGLALPMSAFYDANGDFILPDVCRLETHIDLTSTLGVTYAAEDDNKRKANVDKYKGMENRHKKIFKTKFVKWLMTKSWGRELMFVIFGRKKDKKNAFPAWVVKTDEERAQNLPSLFTNPNRQNEYWIATEKVDGSSSTYTLRFKKNIFDKDEYVVCSRNVAFRGDRKNKPCYYDTNIYLEMDEKFHFEKVLRSLYSDFNTKENPISYITIQGEIFGESVQKRDYCMVGRRFKAFNLIIGYANGEKTRFNPIKMTEILSDDRYNIPCVPVVNEHFVLPESCDKLIAQAAGQSKIDGGMREGLVFRSADGTKSFKAVDNGFLLKYHG